MNLHQELSNMSIFDKENMLDRMTEVRNELHEKNEKLNDQGVYCLETRKKIATVNGNIDIVKKSIYTIIK